jgi:hypothetical protein
MLTMLAAALLGVGAGIVIPLVTRAIVDGPVARGEHSLLNTRSRGTPLGHPLQQPVRADQADPPLAGLLHQPRGQLLVDRVQLGSRRVLGLRVLRRRLRHVVSPPVCRRHTLSWSYTVVFTVPLGLHPGHGTEITLRITTARAVVRLRCSVVYPGRDLLATRTGSGR